MSFLRMEYAKPSNTYSHSHVNAMPMTNESSAVLYPVVSSKVLLSHAKRRLLLEKVRRDSKLENEEQYSLVYRALIESFVEFVQALPATIGGKPGRLMDEGLERGQLALQYYWNEAKGEDPLYAYMIFSAALLLDIGKVVSQQKVIISDKQGYFMDEWVPYSGSLLEKAEYYKLRFLGDRWVDLGKTVAPVLARQLMPELGFLWLSQNYAYFQMWLAVLAGEQGSERNPLSLLLQLIKERLRSQLLEDQLPLLPIEVIKPEETLQGEKFLAWLSEGLQDKTILVNEANAAVHGLNNNQVFLEWPKIARLFDQRVDAVTLRRELNYLGFTKLSGDDYKFEKFFAKYPENLAAERAVTFLAQTRQQQAPFKPGPQMIREGVVLQNTLRLNLSVPPANLQPVAATQPTSSLDNLRELVNRESPRITPSLQSDTQRR